MITNLKELGAKLKNIRETSTFTQKQIAEYLAVDQSLISKIEKGERSISSDLLEKLASLYCMPITELVSKENKSSPYSIAFRTNAITSQDLEALSIINRIALNQLQMDKLAKGGKIDE